MTVLDDDTVVRSDLARQCLYTPASVGKAKVNELQATVTSRRPTTHVVPRCGRSDTLALPELGVDVVFGAVDNVDARLDIDSRCVSTQTPYIDGGFDGTKGYTQTVVPKLTERFVCFTLRSSDSNRSAHHSLVCVLVQNSCRF